METFGENNEMKNACEGVESMEEEPFTASGKGGSGKDTPNTAIRLRAKISDERLLARLRELYPKSTTSTGEFLVEYQRERYQHQNRAGAYRNLEKRLARGWEEPKERVETRPTKSSRVKRLDEKRAKGEKKEARRSVDINE